MSVKLAAALVFSLTAAFPLAGQIAVGPNVQVSSAHPADSHWEVIAAADLKDPARLIASSFLFPDVGGVAQTVVYLSTDGGQTWKPTLRGHTLDNTGDPACAYGPDGSAYYVASLIRPTGPRQMVLFRSADGGSQWSSPTVFTYTDREYVTVDSTTGKYRGRVYVNGNNRIPKDVSDIVVFRSSDNGTTFQGPGTRAGFGKFVTSEMGNAVVSSDGALIAVLTEGRQPSTLMAIRSNNGGESFDPAMPIAEFKAGGNRKGLHNNANALPILAIDASGGKYHDRLYVAWPDRRSGHSEIFFAYSADQGKTWSKARAINDNSPADTTDQFMPTVAVNRDGVVGVLWYDRRDHPDNLGWDARFSASLDGGTTFIPSVQVSEHGTRFGGEARWTGLRLSVSRAKDQDGGLAVQVNLNNFMFIGGDTAGLTADAAGVFHPFWIDNRTGTPQIWTSAVQVNSTATQSADRTDISSNATLELDGITFDRKTGLLKAEARIANTSNGPLSGPFRVRMTALRSELGDLTVASPENGIPGAGATWLFPDVMLAPGEKTSARTIRFHLSNLKPFQDGDFFRLGLLRMNVVILGSPQPSP